MYIISRLTGKLYENLEGNLVEIPLDDSTEAFKKYLKEKDTVVVKYVEATQEELEALSTPNIPEKVKKAAFKLALIKAGISTSSVSDFIYSMPASLSKDKIIVLWEDTAEFYRNDPVLNDMAPLFNISQEQLDQIFILTLSV